MRTEKNHSEPMTPWLKVYYPFHNRRGWTSTFFRQFSYSILIQLIYWSHTRDLLRPWSCFTSFYHYLIPSYITILNKINWNSCQLLFYQLTQNLCLNFSSILFYNRDECHQIEILNYWSLAIYYIIRFSRLPFYC